MRKRGTRGFGTWLLACTVIVCTGRSYGQPSAAATTGFDSYVGRIEARLAQHHGSRTSFVAGLEGPGVRDRLRNGELIIESLDPREDLPGAMLHHWRGTAFAPGAHAADFERILRDFARYPQFYAPQVMRASVLNQNGDHVQATMRVRQKHVLTVVMDTTYDIHFVRVDAQRGYSISRSTKVSEIDAPGTNRERALGPGEDHGFLWRLNTYWTHEERDGGLYLQIESVTLTRSIPAGLGWAVKPFLESVPRESLEFTLRKTVDAMKK